MEALYEEFKDQIRDALKEAGLTQKAFAEKSGIPLRTVEDWCRGARKPKTYNQPEIIAKVFENKKLEDKKMTIYRVSKGSAESRENSVAAFERIAPEDFEREWFFESEKEVRAFYDGLSIREEAVREHYVVTVYFFDYKMLEAGVDCDDPVDGDLKEAYQSAASWDTLAIQTSDAFE